MAVAAGAAAARVEEIRAGRTRFVAELLKLQDAREAVLVVGGKDGVARLVKRANEWLSLAVDEEEGKVKVALLRQMVKDVSAMLGLLADERVRVVKQIEKEMKGAGAKRAAEIRGAAVTGVRAERGGWAEGVNLMELEKVIPVGILKWAGVVMEEVMEEMELMKRKMDAGVTGGEK